MCKETLAVSPRITEIRRAGTLHSLQGTLRMRERLPPAHLSGLQEILGPGGEVPLRGASFLIAAARFGGVEFHTVFV